MFEKYIQVRTKLGSIPTSKNQGIYQVTLGFCGISHGLVFVLCLLKRWQKDVSTWHVFYYITL